jgi:hypothetical protein
MPLATQVSIALQMVLMLVRVVRWGTAVPLLLKKCA